MNVRRFLTGAVVCSGLLSAASCASNDNSADAPNRETPKMASNMKRADPQMKAVLDQLAALDPKPIAELSPPEARQQPTPTDAVMALMKKRGMPTTPEPVGNVENRTISVEGRQIPVRVYTPKGEGPFPAAVYFHGGGWVIATLDTYDASCRGLTNKANCVVVSVDYRQAPEHKFPAAADDAYAATQWVMQNAAEIKVDPKRVAVAGESAGGNLAAVTCLMARDKGGAMPVHQLLVYPVANYAFDTESYKENANAKPLNREMMKWFFMHYLKSPSDGQNPYVSILRAESVNGMPPATVVTAEIDPLMSEGKAYADKLQQAGVQTRYKNYDGVTHEFFGMASVVDKAKQAQQFAADGLKAAFNAGNSSASTN